MSSGGARLRHGGCESPSGAGEDRNQNVPELLRIMHVLLREPSEPGENREQMEVANTSGGRQAAAALWDWRGST